jgi:hypothetical protein
MPVIPTSGFVWSGIDQQSIPASVTTADQGLSKSSPSNVVLGNDVGDPLAPAQFTRNREILTNLHQLIFVNVLDVTAIAANGFSIFDGTNVASFNAIGISTGHFVCTIAGGVNGNEVPFKYLAGVAAQVPVVDGAKNFNGTNEFLTAGGVNYTLAKTLTATSALNFGNTAAQTSADLTIALTGAADGDVVLLGVPIAALNADSCYTAFVSAANVVTVRFNNYSAGAINPASGTFRISIIKY